MSRVVAGSEAFITVTFTYHCASGIIGVALHIDFKITQSAQ